MTEGFDLDFFRIGTLDASTYVSERLKLAIEAEGIKGWDFSPTTNLTVPDRKAEYS